MEGAVVAAKAWLVRQRRFVLAPNFKSFALDEVVEQKHKSSAVDHAFHNHTSSSSESAADL